MFGISKQEEGKLDEIVDRVLADMKQYGPDSPEFPELLKTLEKLYQLKSVDETHKQVSPDVIFTVLGNVACVLVIVAYEQKHVISSRAMTFIARLTGRS